jgi:hypothetical protein
MAGCYFIMARDAGWRFRACFCEYEVPNSGREADNQELVTVTRGPWGGSKMASTIQTEQIEPK